MKTILVTAYAINPYKGSEDGMGWNFVLQIARYHNTMAVTRKNNQPHIEKYFAQHPELSKQKANIHFLYFDWPSWLLTWKKGALLSMIYYYCWQLSVAIWLKKKAIQADIVHNLNFHNDWTPTFLWMLKKPLVWGPVGHHPKIPKQFLRPYGKKAYVVDRLLWTMKNIFWWLDPLLWISKHKASHIFCMNKEAAKQLRIKNKFSIMPSVASEKISVGVDKKESFVVLAIGRFVPLKGFDIAIASFATFYKSLTQEQQKNTALTLVGSGPYKEQIRNLLIEHNIGAVTKVIEWMPREELAQLYKSASVFLFPSHEGAGMVVSEAMSYSLPVLCWKNCGPGEFIHPQSTLVVPYTKYQSATKSFAEKLHSLFTSSSLYTTESVLSLERFTQHFEWNIRGEQLKAVYDEVLLTSVNQPTIPIQYA